MPLYEYRCQDGHVETHLRRDKPAGLPCFCGKDSAPIVSLTAIGSVRGSATPVKASAPSRPTVREVGHSLILIDWCCPACKATAYDVYASRPESKPACACGATMSEVIGAPDVDWFTKACEGNPQGLWSQAAGRFFTSKADRQQWMDTNGFMDGNDVSSDDILRKGSEKRRDNDEYCETMCDEFDRDPAIQRLRDEGRVRGWDHLRPGNDMR